MEVKGRGEVSATSTDTESKKLRFVATIFRWEKNGLQTVRSVVRSHYLLIYPTYCYMDNNEE